MSSTTPAKRNRIFTLSDVQRHSKPKDCWIIHNNKVYDVTAFLDDHPGGDDYIMAHAGKDVTSIMEDPLEHSHSDSAFVLMGEYQVGKIGAEEAIVREDFVYEDGFEPEETAADEDFKKNEFLDLEKPLLIQIWRSQWSKDFYMHQVHQPRHLANRSALLFGPPYLECFTVTSWYIVPLIWTPITIYLFMRSLSLQNGASLVDAGKSSLGWSMLEHLFEKPSTEMVMRSMMGFFFGNFVWTVLEYVMHRFLFHIDDVLPDHPFFLTLHFLLHGIHHYLPMDRLRLVMPPILFTLLSYPFTRLAYSIFPAWFASATVAGAFTFYIGYDTMHYALHHTKLPEYIRTMKSHHMQHHYKEPNMGFGVTSKFWDWVFDTDFKPTPKVAALR